jgi:hypothetical protein
VAIRTIIPISFPFIGFLIVCFVAVPVGLTTEKIAGMAISGGLWILGWILLKWGEKQNAQVFTGAVIGGMLFRIIMVLLSIFFMQKFTKLYLNLYVVSLLIFYFACEFALVIRYLISNQKSNI